MTGPGYIQRAVREEIADHEHGMTFDQVSRFLDAWHMPMRGIARYNRTSRILGGLADRGMVTRVYDDPVSRRDPRVARWVAS